MGMFHSGPSKTTGHNVMQHVCVQDSTDASPLQTSSSGAPPKKQRRQCDLQQILLQKEIIRMEAETKKLQTKQEKLELEKEKLKLEIQLLQQQVIRPSSRIFEEEERSYVDLN